MQGFLFNWQDFHVFLPNKSLYPVFHTSWQVVFLAQKKIFTPKMVPKGQMTLPKEIRTALEIEEGDRVLLRIEDDGKVVLEKAIIIPASKKDGVGEATET